MQKLIPQFSFLENLLDSLIASCGIEKAFLFDVISKIYVATDSNPVDMQTYELCSDMIDVVIDVSCIYGYVLLKYILFFSFFFLLPFFQTPTTVCVCVFLFSPTPPLLRLCVLQRFPLSHTFTSTNHSVKDKGDELDLAYDDDSTSVIRLSSNYVLYLREVNSYLALVCLMKQESFARSGLVDYNVAQFRKAITDLFKAKESFKRK